MPKPLNYFKVVHPNSEIQTIVEDSSFFCPILAWGDDNDNAKATQYLCNFLLVWCGSNKLVFGIVICLSHVPKDIYFIHLS